MKTQFLPFYLRTVQPNPETPRQLLTVDEACEELRVGKWMLNELIRSRQLASIKVGRRRLIPAAAVRDLIDRLQAQGAA